MKTTLFIENNMLNYEGWGRKKYIKHGDNFEYLFNIARNNITQVLDDEKIERKRINKISYGFFYAKAIIMFAALAFLLIIIINVLL